MSIDYRALIADRKAKQTRPIVRHSICLAPELYADLEDAQENLRIARLSTIDDDARAGSDATTEQILEAEAAVKAAEERIAEVVVTAVFKAPTARRQGEHSDELQRLLEASPEKTNEIVVEHAKKVLLETFEYCEAGGERLDLNKADFADMLEPLAQAEALAAHRKLARASTVEAELPFSARRSQGARRSVETSK